MRKRPYFLLISLSVADFLVGVSVLEKIPQLELSTSEHVIRSNIGFLADPSSLYTLTGIALERVLTTAFPFFHRFTGVWLYVILVGFPWLLATAVMTSFIGIFHLGLSRSVEFYLFLTIPISLATIIIRHIALVIRLNCVREYSLECALRQQALRNRKLAVTLVIVTASAITWCLYGLYKLVVAYCDSCVKSTSIILGLKLLRYSNSAINVVVYMSRMTEFRRYILGVFCCNRAQTGTRSSRVRPTNDGETPMAMYRL
ncbi:predicted protein [Nematostella vectensis]|uniref:G-protein coupled receptors family 1 profile domain-containing protein n=1 Tax=Nematostella vectensis TaxID=45351 RepID=A7S904_NEMVE|nr:predicted protein [Nematostella vectensis]|eukprot:XP_001631912.1 predicted protein [Nematostella vectensis]